MNQHSTYLFLDIVNFSFIVSFHFFFLHHFQVLVLVQLVLVWSMQIFVDINDNVLISQISWTDLKRDHSYHYNTKNLSTTHCPPEGVWSRLRVNCDIIVLVWCSSLSIHLSLSACIRALLTIHISNVVQIQLNLRENLTKKIMSRK